MMKLLFTSMDVALRATHSTQVSALTGHKTRHFSNIVRELTTCLRIHAECNSRLNGVSLEFTGEMNDEVVVEAARGHLTALSEMATALNLPKT